ncbi:polyadenylate-binding protein-interacting protein 2 [Culicoides brevitarsis]|uniref:polyadenylate-binding protein-interacting protein 2 n=1 Tax=Culicoides brevitarsis TaxID=469753 RepID=UPI00307B7748
MIMKIPNFTIGNGYYGYGEPYDSNDSDPEEQYLTSSTPSEPDVPVSYSGDFSEYMWMENEEEFDEAEMQRLEEQALMEQCMEAMLEDEIEESEDEKNGSLVINVENPSELCDVLSSLHVGPSNVEKSTLNPLAAEFVPQLPSLLQPVKA